MIVNEVWSDGSIKGMLLISSFALPFGQAIIDNPFNLEFGSFGLVKLCQSLEDLFLSEYNLIVDTDNM